MQVVKNAIIEKDIIQNVIDNREYNKIIIDYYKRFAKDYESLNYELGIDYQETLFNKTKNLNDCNKFWLLDKYEEQKIKDLIKQNLCRDKFCANCKKVKQSARMAKYISTLEEYQDKLFHLTLTVPNCKGTDLKETIKNMNKAFKYLIQYIRGDRKTKDIDFSSWGYEGAVRSLEVTFKGDSYHPHFHIGLVMDPGVLSNKKIENRYSYDNRNGLKELKRLFSEEEILIQKVWYLLINNKRVNKKNIYNIMDVRNDLGEEIVEDIGYTCVMDKFPPDKYVELFKYMTKEKDENGEILSYQNFLDLYIGLYRMKQIQGYGCLYNIVDDIDLEEYEEKYREFIDFIRQKENPVQVLENPQDLILDNQYKLISRKSYFKYLRQL